MQKTTGTKLGLAMIPLGVVGISWSWQFYLAGYYPKAYTTFAIFAIVCLIVSFVVGCILAWPSRKGSRPLVLAVASSAIILWLIKPLHPSDHALLRRFTAQRQTFAQLGDALAQDLAAFPDDSLSLEAITMSPRVRFASRLTPVDDYKDDLARLGFPYGFYTKHRVVIMPVDDWGTFGDQDSKGFAYAAASIDTASALRQFMVGRWTFRSIGDGWYIFTYRG